MAKRTTRKSARRRGRTKMRKRSTTSLTKKIKQVVNAATETKWSMVLLSQQTINGNQLLVTYPTDIPPGVNNYQRIGDEISGMYVKWNLTFNAQTANTTMVRITLLELMDRFSTLDVDTTTNIFEDPNSVPTNRAAVLSSVPNGVITWPYHKGTVRVLVDRVIKLGRNTSTDAYNQQTLIGWHKYHKRIKFNSGSSGSLAQTPRLVMMYSCYSPAGTTDQSTFTVMINGWVRFYFKDM